jgi:hypothetical protein
LFCEAPCHGSGARRAVRGEREPANQRVLDAPGVERGVDL